HAIEISNVFRDDQLQESLPRDQALSNAPQTDGNYFLVPAIL
ncbi:MAG TPA: Asp-tRNA(Asn)/Glu-tRNA(Gln) amidotransferase GatCAB subunit C, partial [Planctomycetaceae bacterium]|nr:Asp-tRNA(Asn)/Glu-tRNA(Gln) amidotransferase GatCAB subunit C [Planctomycetaceae bacterium]